MKSSRVYRRYLLALLLLLMTFNLVDRFALGMVLEAIKRDLQLTDTQLGLMSGIAFALFYSLMGLPIARWADRGNRVVIISLTALLWSIAVGSCALAQSFLQLLMIRVAVGVGEAGGFVPGFSLLADEFERAERPQAQAIYALGTPLSIILGYLFAGWCSELYGWRAMFMGLAAPGFVLGLVAALTLRDPRYARMRQGSSSIRPAQAGPAQRQPTLKQVCAVLWASKTFRHLLLCVSVTFFFMFGILQWQPTFVMRSYGLGSGELGSGFAAVYGVAGLSGTYLGGAWASRYAGGNERLQLRVMTWSIACSAVFAVGIYLSKTLYSTFAFMGGLMFAQAAITGPLYATIQTLVPERMRAMAVALVMLFANLIGLGFGPLAAGALSDALRPWAGAESLRYALLLLSPGLLWAAWHAHRASRKVGEDLGSVLDDEHRRLFPAAPVATDERSVNAQP